MARSSLFYGFETLDLLAEGQSNTTSNHPAAVGSVAIETGIVRSGAGSLKLTPASGAAGYWDGQVGVTTTAPFLRFYVRVTVLPSSTRYIFASTGILRLTSTGAIELYGGGGTLIGTSTTTLSDPTRWYRIEVKQQAGAWELRIDGLTEVSGSQLTTNHQLRFGATDTVAATYTAYIDDIAYDTANWLGAGVCLLLLPTSDNTVTNWTAGAGSASNLWDAVNNTPPAGVASASETNTSNIESANGSGTAAYTANVQSYTASGIAPADSINADTALIRHGEDIATGTKTGTFELTGNPVIAATTFTFGLDGGAHAAEGASGLWRTYRSPVSASPVVTLGTAPTIKIVKTDTGTRAACVDLMGVYVEYTPATATAQDTPELYGRPYGHGGQVQMQQLLAQ
jgi:hypothetical protein